MASTDEIILCANCGKGEVDSCTLRNCVACKMVRYCNRDCQIAHRPQHKKACKKRAAELHYEKLFKDHAPREDCPICMIPLPIIAGEASFKLCCGKDICFGCNFTMAVEDIKRGKKEEEFAICAFCRTPEPMKEEGSIDLLKKLMEKGNPMAFNALGLVYAEGGLTGAFPQDYTKANDLYQKAGDLGCGEGYCNLGVAYQNGWGMEVDSTKAKHFYERAAIQGSVTARYYLGFMEQDGNFNRTYKHFILAAKAGHKDALGEAKRAFVKGWVTKEEYESTLRAHHERHIETKSSARDMATDNTADIIAAYTEHEY